MNFGVVQVNWSALMFKVVNINQCLMFKKKNIKTPLNLGLRVANLELSRLHPLAERMFWWQGELNTRSEKLLIVASACV